MIIRTIFKQHTGGAMERKDQPGLTTDGPSAAIIQSAAENLLRSSFSVQIVCHSSRGNFRFADHLLVIDAGELC